GAGITNHFLRLRSDTETEVRPAEKIALEVIYRRRAYGSFLSRYRDRVKPMADLDLVEFCLKDDNLGDPLVTPQAVVKLELASSRELEQVEEMTRKVASLIQKNLAELGLELIDMKLEFGKIDGKLAVVDEISGDTMRVYDSKKRRMLNQLELARKLGVA
ncbi:MAG: phosphoribosylaminoimidazolesuccinocarboxamide synthase, partial [Candidatus Hadarchaeota archaeon]|nr:phosphoribosylaminoimidazolesuccinocarboxamide synthase [Candidatus Hadarchaeota archaeon]